MKALLRLGGSLKKSDSFDDVTKKSQPGGTPGDRGTVPLVNRRRPRPPLIHSQSTASTGGSTLKLVENLDEAPPPSPRRGRGHSFHRRSKSELDIIRLRFEKRFSLTVYRSSSHASRVF